MADLSSERFFYVVLPGYCACLTFNYLMTLDRPNGDSQADERRDKFVDSFKVLSSQQRISPEGSQTDSQPKYIYISIYILEISQGMSSD